jgi:apolipoprotein N-acyltransferase
MTKVRKYGLALLAGVVLASSGPPLDLVPAVWVAMAALAWLLEDGPEWPPFASRGRVATTGALRGLAFGVGANLVLMRFVPLVIVRFTPLPWVAGAVALVLLAAFEGLRWAVACVACETLARARVPRPLAFAAGVYAGTFVPTIMPWAVADAVSPWPVLVQLADVVGGRGVSALMALTAGLAASGLRAALLPATRRRGVASLVAALAVVAAQVGTGVARMASIDRLRAAAPHVAVGLVQPSVGATTRWEDERAASILEELVTLTRRAEAHGAELVVWHEAAYPYRLPHGSHVIYDATRAIVPTGVHGPVLTGLLLTGGADGAATNSVLVATRDGALSESYDKRHLLWFGETVPLADRLPWLRQVFARGLGLAAGDRSEVLQAGRVRAAVLVCYEDMLPEAGREAMEGSPNLVVNVTNDAWFVGTSESEQHLRVAVMRAVELRRDMVRAVNLGPTSLVDAAGRVLARASIDVPTALVTQPALLEGAPTLYARFGDAPWALALLVLANVAVWRVARRR